MNGETTVASLSTCEDSQGLSYLILNFDQVKELTMALERISAEVMRYEYSNEAFGSWTLTVRHRGTVYRVVFDGRDGVHSIEHSSTKGSPYPWGQTIWEQSEQSQQIPIETILKELLAVGDI